MNARFLTPVASAEAPARSPLADAGSRTVLADGWELLAGEGDPEAEAAACAGTVGIADRSSLTKLELQAAPDLLERVAGRLAPGSAVPREGSWSCPVAPGLRLELHPAGTGEARRAEHEAAGVRTCELTASLGAISVCGPRAAETIARFSAIDTRPGPFPRNGFRPVSVARTPGYVLREDAERFLLLFGAAYGAYMWQTVESAATSLGGRAVAASSLPPIEPEAADA